MMDRRILARGMTRVRRALFEPVDHVETHKFLEQELAKQTVRDSTKWGFDFHRAVPLSNKRYEWTPVQQPAVNLVLQITKKRPLDDNSGEMYPQLDDQMNGEVSKIDDLIGGVDPAKIARELSKISVDPSKIASSKIAVGFSRVGGSSKNGSINLAGSSKITDECKAADSSKICGSSETIPNLSELSAEAIRKGGRIPQVVDESSATPNKKQRLMTGEFIKKNKKFIVEFDQEKARQMVNNERSKTNIMTQLDKQLIMR